MSSLPPESAPQRVLPAWAVAEGPFGIRLLDAGIVALVIAAVEVNVIVGTGPGAVPLNLTAYLLGALLAVPILFRHRWPFRVLLASAVLMLLYAPAQAGSWSRTSSRTSCCRRSASWPAAMRCSRRA